MAARNQSERSAVPSAGAAAEVPLLPDRRFAAQTKIHPVAIGSGATLLALQPHNKRSWNSGHSLRLP
jgi:hypothetical protein